MDFSALEEIEKQTEVLHQKVSDRFAKAYENALLCVSKLNMIRAEDFFAPLPMRTLHEASRELSQAISIKPSIPEPYALLSYLFFLMNNMEMAVKYLRKAHDLAPEWPKVQELRVLYLHYMETLEIAHEKKAKGEFNTLENPPEAQYEATEAFLLLDF